MPRYPSDQVHLVRPSGDGDLGVKKEMDSKRFEKLWADFERSGLSRKAFCAQQGISYWTFSGWAQQFGMARKKTVHKLDNDFMELHIPPEPKGAARAIRIRYGADVVIDIPLP